MCGVIFAKRTKSFIGVFIAENQSLEGPEPASGLLRAVREYGLDGSDLVGVGFRAPLPLYFAIYFAYKAVNNT